MEVSSGFLYILIAFFTVLVIEGCKKNLDCASGFCDGGTFWKSGTCRSLVADGGRCLEGGDANSCTSKSCICGYCGRKMADGYSCSTNSNCGSGWCNGVVTIGCSGKCKSKTPDGQRCQGANDGNSCASGQCTCGYCGRKMRENYACSTNENCQSGWCNGVFTTGCRGKCKSKTSDYGSCPLNIHGSGDNNNCKSGRCEKVSATKAICAPRNGFREGAACNEDTDCDKTRSLWCNGGSFYSSGVCTRCPSKCPDGCNAIFNQMSKMKCGRMTTFDHAADLAKKISKPIVEFLDCLSPKNQYIGCSKDVVKGFASCLDPSTPCKIKLGGQGSACLAFTNPGLSYNYQSEYVTLSGSVKPIGGVSVEADITDGKINLAIYGRIAVKAQVVFQATASKTTKYSRKLYLTDCVGKKCSVCKSPTSKLRCRPMILYMKAFVIGYVPVIIELKIQAVAELSLEMKTEATFQASLSYDNDAIVSIKKAIATFDPIKGVKLDVAFSDNFDKQIQKTLAIQGAVGLKGVLRVGAEITVAVNGIPITIYPAARLVAEGNTQLTNAGCLTGSFAAGIGLDAGISIGFVVPNPAPLMGAVCRALVEKTCNIPGVNVANCAVKVATKTEPCKEAQGLCGKLEGEIAKLVPENLGKKFTGSTNIIKAAFASFNVTGKGYCLGGQIPFVSGTDDVMTGKLEGGGGGSGIRTCGAPGVSRKCQQISGGYRSNHENLFCSLFILPFMLFILI